MDRNTKNLIGTMSCLSVCILLISIPTLCYGYKYKGTECEDLSWWSLINGWTPMYIMAFMWLAVILKNSSENISIKIALYFSYGYIVWWIVWWIIGAVKLAENSGCVEKGVGVMVIINLMFISIQITYCGMFSGYLNNKEELERLRNREMDSVDIEDGSNEEYEYPKLIYPIIE